MKAFIIYIRDSYLSLGAVADCLLSIVNNKIDLDLELFPATTPDTLEHDWQKIFPYTHWKDLWEPKVLDIDKRKGNGIVRHKSFNTLWLERRISCFISHYKLWKISAELNSQILILEQDAFFIKKFSFAEVNNSFYQDVLNLASLSQSVDNNIEAEALHAEIAKDYKQENKNLVKCFDINYLPTNSAYIVKPNVIDKVNEWIERTSTVVQNDNLLAQACKIQTCYPYFTSVTKISKSINQHLPSSVSITSKNDLYKYLKNSYNKLKT